MSSTNTPLVHHILLLSTHNHPFEPARIDFPWPGSRGELGLYKLVTTAVYTNAMSMLVSSYPASGEKVRDSESDWTFEHRRERKSQT